MEPADHVAAVLVFLLAAVYPVADARRYAAELSRLRDDQDEGRIRVYRVLILHLCGMSALVFGLWWYQGYSLQDISAGAAGYLSLSNGNTADQTP